MRMTKLRKVLLETMLKSKIPLSVEGLLMSLARQKLKTHKTSIYRQLETMKREKVIKEIRLGEMKRRYEIYPDNHHHHLVCIHCEEIRDVNTERDLDAIERKIAKEKKFIVIDHSLEFFGVCAGCQ